jgi:PKD repeat protein
MAAPAHRASVASVHSIAASIDATRPAYAEGDIILIFATVYRGTSSGSVMDIPSGFTLIDRGNCGLNGNERYGIFYKVAGASEPSIYTVSVSGGQYWNVIVASFSGSVGVNVSGVNVDPSNTPRTSYDAPSVTTTAADTLLIGLNFLEGTATDTVTTPPSGFTSRVSNHYASLNSRVTLADAAQAAAGASGTKTFTFAASNTTRYLAALVALEPGVALPVAGFSGTPLSGPAPLTVQFADESTNDPTSWDWDFGDSGTSTDQHPEHEYTTPGSYDVGLEVTNAAGSDDEIKAGYITVTGPEPGIEGFSVAFDDPTLEPDPTWTRLA